MTTTIRAEGAPLRLRALHPLRDGDGACALVYDLERTMVFEVPAELRGRIAPALEARALDGPLAAWMAAEDLLTADQRASWAQGSRPPLPRLTDLSLDMSGSCNMGCVYCFENDIYSRTGRMEDATALAALDFLFRAAGEAPRVAVHFGSGEPLIRFDLLRTVVDEARRRGEAEGREVVFDLTTNATLVTAEIARFLAAHPFRVRVSCDGPPRVHDAFRPLLGGQGSYRAVERGLRLLLEHLPDRVTVNSVLAGGTRLVELWAWARAMGVRHYHVIKVGAYAERDLNLREAELRDFREDLEIVCDDVFGDLEAGEVPIDYQPVTKVVRRLMIPEPITRFCGVAGSYLGVSSTGKVYPCFRHLGLDRYELGDVWSGVDGEMRREFLGREAADVDTRPVCRDCWARYLCGGGCYADSTVYGPDRGAPQVQHCPFWRTEIEMAIRFYRRLVAADPAYCLRLFGDDFDALFASVEGGGAAFMKRTNCQ